MVDLFDTFAVILKNATSLYLSAAQVFKDGFYRRGAYDIAVLEQLPTFVPSVFLPKSYLRICKPYFLLTRSCSGSLILKALFFFFFLIFFFFFTPRHSKRLHLFGARIWLSFKVERFPVSSCPPFFSPISDFLHNVCDFTLVPPFCTHCFFPSPV